MSLLHISSERYGSSDPDVIYPSYVDNNSPAGTLYNNARYQINPVSLSNKRCTFKEFGFNYCILTLNESFNRHMKYINITDNTEVIYTFTPSNFLNMNSFITYLNSVCTDLHFVFNDPTVDPQANGIKNGRISINHVDGSKSFRLQFDSKSIFRLLGFYFGTTEIVPAGSTITGVYNATLQPIGTMYLNLGFQSENLSNLSIAFNYILTVLGSSGGQPANFGEKIRIFNNTSYDQEVFLKTTQFNQVIISITDSFGNYVPLNSIYTLVLGLEDK